MQRKYRNVKVKTKDGVFDSKKEHARFGILKLLERAGEISDLKTQVPFRIDINGVHICKYVADFVFNDKQGNMVVEDTKSPMTRKLPVYRLKRKLMKALHQIEIKEV